MAGFTRFRSHQLGKQTVLGTAVSATRRVPWRGAIVVNPTRTNPDADTGSRDPVMSPYNGPLSVTATITGPEAYNDLPYRWAAAVKSNVSPTGGGTAKTWTFQAASLTVEGIQFFTDQWGDDTNATDGIQAFGGVIDTFEETMPQDLSPWTFSDQWVFAGATLQTAQTGSLSVDTAPIWVYGADTEIKMDPTAAAIGTTKLSNALHQAVFRISNNLDQKRFANGSNTRFQLHDYGYGERVIELVLTFAKTAEVITEAATLDDDPVPNRYFEILTTSPSLAQAGTPYQYRRRIPARLFSREDGEIGGNATITLTYRAFYDSTLTYALYGQIVNTLSAL